MLTGTACLLYIVVLLSAILFGNWPSDDEPPLWDRIIIQVLVIGGLGVFLLLFAFVQKRTKVLK